MSAPAAGKFQDHYEILGIDPKSDSEAVQRAYTRLAQTLNPQLSATGDAEKFAELNHAYEVLSDPLLRREFDKLKGINVEEGTPQFSGLEFFDALGRQSTLRNAVLSVLYDRRRTRPFTPSLTLRNIENMLNATVEDLNFVIWYLKQRGLVTSDDKSCLQVTVEGMDYLESNPPPPQTVMALIKGAAPIAPPEPPPAPSKQIESLRRSLSLPRRTQ